MAVDIIIPIYNAYEKLEECLAGVFQWTHFNGNRLILINDNSSDQRIRKLLDSIKQNYVIIIHNQENRGFPANVNIGIEQSQTQDVLLLNSDTVVTKGWVEKLEACAYSDCGIATATPLSNNATLCSVPDFCTENKIPHGYSLDEYAQLIENVSMKQYPQIPVANGFCMYIKREVIQKIGGFDAETFGRGYGEENDFCYRAIEAGWHHVMCDDTYILHTGTESFTSREKNKNIKEHEKILMKRYGKLSREVQIHCRDHPNAFVAENIRFWTEFERDREKKTVMYLVQSDFRQGASDHIGGTQLHVKDLTEGMRRHFYVLVAARDRSYLNITLYTKTEEFFFRYYMGTQSEYERFRCGKAAWMYGRLLEIFRVSCVHIHHTKGLTLELYYEAEKRNIPVITTLHDYFYVCPGVKLLDEEDRLCIGKESTAKCRTCIKKRFGIADTVPYIRVWREESRMALDTAAALVVPTKSAEDVILRYFPQMKEKIKVVEHGLLPVQTGQMKNKTAEGEFHVAFLGGINRAKGLAYARELIQSKEKGIRWYLFGNFEQQSPGLIRKRNFIDVGTYTREELPKLFEKYSIDLVCILSIWPETYSYTLSEAVACGIPVLVTGFGALGERVREMDCGWIVPKEAAAEDLRNIIRQLKDRGDDYQKKAEKARGVRLRTAEEMCSIYRKMYEEKMTAGRKQENTPDYSWMYQDLVYRQNALVLNAAGTGNLIEQLEETEKQLDAITKSFTYRMVLAAARYVPFRRQLKPFLYRIIYTIKKFR